MQKWSHFKVIPNTITIPMQTYLASEVVSLDLCGDKSVDLVVPGNEIATVCPFFMRMLLQEVTLVFLKAE